MTWRSDTAAWLVGAACLGCGGAEIEEQPPSLDLSTRVAFAAPRAADEVVVATLPAQVVSAPGGVHAVGPGVAGRLTRWWASPGQSVAAGDPLAAFVSGELTALAAQATRDAVAAEGARRVLDVQERALAGGVAGADVTAAAALEEASARATASAQRATLAAHQDTTTPSSDGWTWRSPVDGVIDDLRCALGTVDAGRACVDIVVPGAVVVQVGLPERYLDVASSPLSGTFIAADGRRWPLVELSRAPAVSTDLRALTVRFSVAGGAPLVGASGRAEVRVPAQPGDVVVPEASVTRLDGASVVFVAGGQPAVVREVAVVGRHAEGVVVRGLGPGDEVAVRGTFLLKSLVLLGDEEGE